MTAMRRNGGRLSRRAADFVAAVRANPTLAAVTFEGFLTRLGFSMVGFALPLFALSLGMKASEIGVLYALRTVTTILVKPVMGWAADRFGQKRTLTLAVVLRCVVGLLFVFASLPWHLYAIRLLQGAMTAARDPSATALIAEHGDQRRMAASFAWYSTARDVGKSLGYGVAGLLIGLTGTFRFVFFVAFLTSCVALVMVIRYVRAPRADAAHAATRRAAGAVDGSRALYRRVLPYEGFGLMVAGSAEMYVREPRIDGHAEGRGAAPARTRAAPAAPARGSWGIYRGLLAYAGFGLMVAGSAEMMAGFFPVIATEYAGLTRQQAGLAVSASAIVFIVAGPLFGWLSDNVSRKLALGSRSVANTLSSLMYILFPSFGGFMAAKMVDDTGKAAFRPTWGAVLAEVSAAHPGHRARTITFVDSAYTGGEVVGPLVAGLLLTGFGVPAMLGVRAALSIITEIQAVVTLRKGRPGAGLPASDHEPQPPATRSSHLLPATAPASSVHR